MNAAMSLRQHTAKALEVEESDVGFERALNVSLLALILANVAAVILETVDSLRQQYSSAFGVFEVVSVAVFSVEYALRIWTCVEQDRYRRPLLGRLRDVFSPLALVDLVAILPAYLPAFLPVDLRFLRAVRLLRLTRALKIARHNEVLHLPARVVRAKRQELTVTAILGLVVLLAASGLMYLAENEAQPKIFHSVPAAMWWAVVTLTTVGDGDIYPITPLEVVQGAPRHSLAPARRGPTGRSQDQRAPTKGLLRQIAWRQLHQTMRKVTRAMCSSILNPRRSDTRPTSWGSHIRPAPALLPQTGTTSRRTWTHQAEPCPPSVWTHP